MIADDATKPEIDAIAPSTFPLLRSDRPENHLAGTRLPRFVRRATRSLVVLRDKSKRHDGELLSPGAVPDAQFDHGTGWSTDESVRRVGRGSEIVADWGILMEVTGHVGR